MVQASTDSAFSVVNASSSTAVVSLSTLTVTGLSAGTTYYFRVGSLNWDNVAVFAASVTTQTLTTTNYYWVSGSPSNWNNAANWAAVSGGTGGLVGVPLSTSSVVFDGNGLGNCTIDTTVNISTLTISVGYTGAINTASRI